MGKKIFNLDRATTHEIKYATRLWMRMAPRGHLGKLTRRDDIHGAFEYIRAHVKSGRSVWEAAVLLENVAHTMAEI